MPGMAGDDGRLSSGVLAGGVGMLMMAAVKSRCSQFNFRSSVLALRLERLFEKEIIENVFRIFVLVSDKFTLNNS